MTLEIYESLRNRCFFGCPMRIFVLSDQKDYFISDLMSNCMNYGS